MNTPIFDLVCLEYPEIMWWQDTARIFTYQGEVLRTALGPLKANFHGD